MEQNPTKKCSHIKFLILGVIALGVIFVGGMEYKKYQIRTAVKDVFQEASQNEWNDLREKSNEASVESKKRQLLLDILVLESDLGTYEHNWDMEDIKDFSVEYMEQVKAELEAKKNI